MQISLKTIRDRHVGISWMPSPVSLMLLAKVANKDTSLPVAFSDWHNDNPFAPDYIPVVFTPEHLSLEWERDWVQPYKALSITANCAWRVHPDTNLNGVVAITAVGANVTLIDTDNPIQSVRGGNGAIDIWALYDGAPGTATIVLEYRNTTIYTKVNINITVNDHGMAQTLMIEPMTFEIDGDPQQITTKAYYAGSIPSNPPPSLVSKPDWMTLDSITKDPSSPDAQPIYDVIFSVNAFNKLCPHDPRTGTFTLTSNNGTASGHVTQQSRIITPQPWPIVSDGVVYDASGNPYNYVTIGDYQVLLQNLRTTQYRNGTPIQNASSVGYDNININYDLPWYKNGYNVDIFGRLYSMNAVNLAHPFERWGTSDYPGNGGFMAESADAYATANSYGDEYMWHPPSYTEWLNILGTPEATRGERMKCTRTVDTNPAHPTWWPPNPADNSLQMSVFPAGRYQRDSDSHFGLGTFAYFWVGGVYAYLDNEWELYQSWPRRPDRDYSRLRIIGCSYSQSGIFTGMSEVGAPVVPPVSYKTSFASIRLVRKHDL